MIFPYAHFLDRKVLVDAKNHGTDEQLERYTLGSLPAAETESLEEHLLICDACRERTETSAVFATAMREALKQEARAAQTVATRVDWLSWPRRPAFQMALAFVLLLAAIAIFSGRGGGLPPVATLQLSATRGEMPSVKPARELDLVLAGAPADGGPFRVEVVNAGGGKIWNNLADSEGDTVPVKVTARLGPGDYFVRLYSGDGAMLHEYGFRVAN